MLCANLLRQVRIGVQRRSYFGFLLASVLKSGVVLWIFSP